MKKVFIVHGFGGMPNGGWIPWLMKELAQKRIFACALAMPDSKKPTVLKWTDEISHAINNATEDEIILVGHSLGATAVLKYLENKTDDRKIACAILVSGLISPLELENPQSNYRMIDSFVVPELDFEKIKNKVGKFIVVHSTDDPAVPFSHGEKISKALGCNFIKLEKGGHFFILSEPICYEFPELLSILEEVII